VLCPGTVFNDCYRLKHHISEGGMGIVWAAERLDSEERVALKFMKAAPDQIGLRRRFLREARAACSIEHPNVVRVFEVLDLAEYPAIVMELLDGESLAERLSRDAPLPPGEVADILLPVASAVSTTHQLGIVHRDLKPDNIFLARQPDGDRVVKVLDFGIAKLTGTGAAAATAHATTTGALLGTPAYMSPEQVFGEKDVDHRTDIWSLGMILYECLTGVLPTRAENVGQIIKLILTRNDWKIEEVAPELPEDLIDIVRRMLARDPQRRPTLRMVAEVLERHAGTQGPPVAAEPRPSRDQHQLGFVSTVAAISGDDRVDTGPVEPSSTRHPSRRRLGIIAALALLGAAAGGYVWSRSQDVASAEPALATAAPAPEPEPPAAAPLAAAPPAASTATTAAADTAVATPEPATTPTRKPATRTARTTKDQPPPAVANAPPAPTAPPNSSSSLQSAVVGKPPF
jgi:eukaryotic-like serine/threonine-protein kinase